MKTKILLSLIVVLYSNYSHAVDMERVNEIIEFLKIACASDESFEVDVEGDVSGGISIALLRKGKLGALEGKLRVSQTEMRGALSNMKDELRHAENQKIRECMEPRIDRIIDMMSGSNSSSIRTLDFDDIRLSIDNVGVFGSKRQLTSEWTLRNNTNEPRNALIAKQNTSVLVRTESDAFSFKIEGISFCDGATNICRKWPDTRWTLLQPHQTIKFRIVTMGYKPVTTPNTSSYNIRLLVMKNGDWYHRDFSFSDISI